MSCFRLQKQIKEQAVLAAQKAKKHQNHSKAENRLWEGNKRAALPMPANFEKPPQIPQVPFTSIFASLKGVNKIHDP